MVLKTLVTITVLFTLLIQLPLVLAGEPNPAPSGEATDLVLPLDENHCLTLERLVIFAGDHLKISLLVDPTETEGCVYQFTSEVKVPGNAFQGYFERMLLEKGFLYIQTGEGPDALHRIVRIGMNSPGFDIRLGCAGKVIPLEELDQYMERGLLITVVVPLKNALARETMTSLNFYFQKQLIESIRPVERTNTLILTGPAPKIYYVVQLIREMDAKVEPCAQDHQQTATDLVEQVRGLEKRIQTVEKALADTK
ncbi:MAG: hypothetical protein KJ645_11920 [Planctomycetes bacterium]|nr:hypothetical protein [Planctomycetota bacterium]